MIEMADPNFGEQLKQEYSSLKANRAIVRQLPRPKTEQIDPQPGDPNDKVFGEQLRRELEELKGRRPGDNNVVPPKPLDN